MTNFLHNIRGKLGLRERVREELEILYYSLHCCEDAPWLGLVM
jgi:hypothetical protein